jgi:hypothetical protein
VGGKSDVSKKLVKDKAVTRMIDEMIESDTAIADSIKRMNLDNVRAFIAEINEASNTAGERIIKIGSKYFSQEWCEMNERKTEMETNVKAIEDGLNVALTKEFYGNHGYDMVSFYNALESHRDELEKALKDQQELQRMQQQMMQQLAIERALVASAVRWLSSSELILRLSR